MLFEIFQTSKNLIFSSYEAVSTVASPSFVLVKSVSLIYKYFFVLWLKIIQQKA